MIGADVGTYNLITCKRNEEKDFVFKKEVNAFLKFSLEDPFVFNIMKTVKDVPMIQREDEGIAYVLGEAAVRMAYTLKKLDLSRPMKDGCVNPKEHDAFHIMNIMIHSLLDGVEKDQEIVYYSVPANAINEETDADYHSKILEAIFKAYESPEGYKVDARPLNEGMALVYSELADKNFTGIGVSCGAGMVNVAFGLYGTEVFKFAIVNSGDWIDKQAAKALSESPAFVNKEKTKVDLNKVPVTLVERAIQTQYELMIQKTIGGIKKGLEENENEVRLDEPIDIVVAGGTASPPGFDNLFRDMIKNAGLPMKIGEVIRPDEPVYSVAKGCLVAAEFCQPIK